MKEKKAEKKAVTARPDGRRPFMTYMDPELIKSLKRQALDTDMHAYELVEGFVADGLARKNQK